MRRILNLQDGKAAIDQAAENVAHVVAELKRLRGFRNQLFDKPCLSVGHTEVVAFAVPRADFDRFRSGVGEIDPVKFRPYAFDKMDVPY